MAASTHRKWYQIKWFADIDTKEDRKLIWKLDLLIVPYALLSYWVKYIDQANLNNAYVAGLKEELGFEGNQLVRLQTMYIVGAVLGQIPFLFLFTYLPMYWIIPFLDVAWGIFTLLQYRAHSFAELAAYRFLVGWFEASFFPAMHFIFGSWYRSDEIARRGGVFYVGLTLGTLTAGLIQAGASSRLDGVHGLSGWRWMYIICSVITIPVGICFESFVCLTELYKHQQRMTPCEKQKPVPSNLEAIDDLQKSQIKTRMRGKSDIEKWEHIYRVCFRVDSSEVVSSLLDMKFWFPRIAELSLDGFKSFLNQQAHSSGDDTPKSVIHAALNSSRLLRSP